MKVSIAPDFENALPEHTEAELSQLEKNVLADPSHDRMPPIVVWENHKNTIIDGHHQYKLRVKHRLKIKYQKRTFDTRQDAMREAYSIQLGRRNWSASQRALAAVEFTKLLGKSSADSTVILQSAAEVAGVSEKTAWDAKKVIDQSPKAIVAKVKSGEIAASDAAAITELSKAEQTKALKDVESGRAKTLRGAAFDPEKLDKQPARNGKPKKSGKPSVTRQDRTNAQKHLGGLIRALSAMDLYDEFVTPLSQIATRLKQV